jgi:hypothetical protein
VFDWENPPEGGHPGEAPNCRCWAEVVNSQCEVELQAVIQASRAWSIARAKLVDLEPVIHNTRLKIDGYDMDISTLESVVPALSMGRVLTFVPHPLARVAKTATDVTLAMVKGRLFELSQDRDNTLQRLSDLEAEYNALKPEVQRLKSKADAAQRTLDACRGA